jgi:ribosomal protein S27AE
MKKKKLNCPRCGAEMNNHAEKVSYEESAGGYKPDPVFGGVMEDIFTCPGCGNVESRAAG